MTGAARCQCYWVIQGSLYRVALQNKYSKEWVKYVVIEIKCRAEREPGFASLARFKVYLVSNETLYCDPPAIPIIRILNQLSLLLVSLSHKQQIDQNMTLTA